MSTTSRTFHFLAALISVALFFAAVRLLPSLKTASDAQVAVKCLIEVAIAVAILFGLMRWGRQSPAALGVRRPTGSSLGWAVLCFLASVVVSALTLFVFKQFGVGQDKATLAALASRPVPVILLIAATAGIAEEIIFRSVLISQLQLATGSAWVAGLVSLLLFGLAHAAGWGAWQILFAIMPGLVLTLFFLWKRDLWICMIAHFLTDALGLLSAAAAMAQHRP